MFFSPLAFLFAIQTSAQQTAAPSPTRDPAAVALLAKSLAVMTGGQPISDVTLQGTARRIAGSDDETGTAVVKAMADGHTRLDLSLPSSPRGEVRSNSSDGPKGSWRGPDGLWHAISHHNLMTDAFWPFPAFALGRVLASQNHSITYVGRETRDGRAVEHVKIARAAPAGAKATTAAFLEHLSQMDIFLDSASLLPVALTFNTHPDNDAGLDIPIEIRFSDYRGVNGAQVPFSIQKFLNNGLVLDFQLQTASFNTGLSASSFSF